MSEQQSLFGTPRADIEKELWEAAVKLRGSVAPSDYKHYVLPLLFLRYLSLRYEHRHDELDRLIHDPASDYHTDDPEIAEDEAGWGAKVIQRLSDDLRQAFPDMRGFSVRNLNYMRAFAEAYADVAIVQQAAAQIPWFHNCTLLVDMKSRGRVTRSSQERRSRYDQHLSLQTPVRAGQLHLYAVRLGRTQELQSLVGWQFLHNPH